MLVTIVNYNKNANAIKLKGGFEEYVPVSLIDSGSDISPEEVGFFDECLPNVFYNGLINHAFEQANSLADDEPIVFICSDVEIESYSHFVECVKKAFSNPQVQVYAPTSKGSGHPQMWPAKSGGLRQVSFVEGFCFVARKQIFAQACPIDLTINKLGWGVDVYFAYLAVRFGGVSVVDDGLSVFHPQSTGYNTAEAASQRNNWFELLPKSAKIYRFFATLPGFREGVGYRFVRFFISLFTSKPSI